MLEGEYVYLYFFLYYTFLNFVNYFLTCRETVNTKQI